MSRGLFTISMCALMSRLHVTQIRYTDKGNMMYSLMSCLRRLEVTSAAAGNDYSEISLIRPVRCVDKMSDYKVGRITRYVVCFVRTCVPL